MKEIKLSKHGKNAGKYFAMVDDEDYKVIQSFNWCYRKGKNKSTGYAVRGINQKRFGGGTEDIKMHRVILGLEKGDKNQVDHIDGNGLNNQKYNLRISTVAQNNRNRLACGSSKYLGVSLIRRKNKRQEVYFTSTIVVDKKRVYLGSFPPTKEGEVQAALAYNKAIIKYKLEFGRLNIIT